ncbi:MAG: GNAT family N-acetyltransferase [Candidatus Hodarchaeota archaeon]
MVLEGSLVILREERKEDMELLVTLRNNLDTQAWGKALPPDYTLPMYIKRFEERTFSYDRSEGRFIIILKETQEFVGMMIYTDHQPRFEATIGIAILKKYWGHGIAYDAQEALLKFLFVELGVRVVRLWTQIGNKGMVKLAQRSGFKISGRLRQAAFIHGDLYDTLIIDLLREEYFALHPELTNNLPEMYDG